MYLAHNQEAECACEQGQPHKKGIQPSLADVPDLWIAQLVCLLSPRDKLSVFMASRTLRDAVLSHTASTQLMLRLQAYLLMTKQGHSLALASTLASKVALRLVGDRHASSSSAAEFLTSFAMSKTNGSLLTGIKRVILQGMQLSSLIPSSIACSCPNVDTMHLDNCTVSNCTFGAIDNLPWPMPKLRVLHIAADTRVQQSECHLKKQLQGMTGLTDLSLGYTRCLTADVLRTLAGSLTRLEWIAIKPPESKAFQLHLALTGTLINLPKLQQLITHEKLTTLTVHAILVASVTKVVALRSLNLVSEMLDTEPLTRALTLQTSRITTQDLHNLPNRAFAVLEGMPQQQQQQQQPVGRSTLIVRGSDTPPSKTLSWLANNSQLCLNCSNFVVSCEASAAVVAGLILRLTPSCTHIMLNCLHPELTPAALIEVANAISQIPNSIHLSICSGLATGTLHQLLRTLPPNVHTVQIARTIQTDTCTEQDIQRMCNNAVRPIVVILTGWDLGAGWQQHVTRGIAAHNIELKQHPNLPDDLQYSLEEEEDSDGDDSDGDEDDEDEDDDSDDVDSDDDDQDNFEDEDDDDDDDNQDGDAYNVFMNSLTGDEDMWVV